MTDAVIVRDVGRRYALGEGVTIAALEDVTLHVPEASTVGLCGPSGSGKSTLLHLIGGLEQPDDGTVEVAGRALGSLSRRDLAAFRRSVGFVFQRFNLLPALTAIDNVVAPLLPYRVAFDKYERASELLRAVGLAGRESSLPSRLSGGQQQRVAIARALVNRPSLVVADEPTGNLDSQTGTAIVDLLLDLRTRMGVTVLLATHDPAVARRCDRIVRLLDGRITSDDGVDRCACAG